MKLSYLLPPLTLVLLGIAVSNVVIHKWSDSETPTRLSAATTSEGQVPLSIPAGDRSLLSGPQSLLIAGIASRVPEADDYRLISELPWDYRDASRLFRDAGPDMSCELLIPGMEIVQPLVAPRESMAGPLGRLSLFSIRLRPDDQLGDGLPSVTRGIITDYLRAHQLTIQPTLYSDAQQRLIMGPRVRAAFMQIESPAETIAAEAMIATSIGELRTLGAYWASDAAFDPALMRTLLLGLRYSLDADAAAGRKEPRREYEVVCLHLLPDSTAADPKIAVFATSDARTQFHLLEPSDPMSPADMAAVTADIRFADARMLGMYPESPIVTRVTHQAILSIPIDVVQAELEGLGGVVPKDGLSSVLDTLYYKTMGIDPPAATPPAVERPEPSTRPARGEQVIPTLPSSPQKAPPKTKPGSSGISV